tara:strand:- start:113 stop:265 length:153 start_codon:yes stop_codon:yes gene_type:complete
MGMTRKHYKAIAKAISLNKGKESIIPALASVFADDNPNFDWAKFVEACRE